MTCSLAAVVTWNPWSMAADFKQTERYNELVGNLLHEATRAAMGLPTEDAKEASVGVAAERGGYDVAFDENTYTITQRSGEAVTVLMTEATPTLANEGANIAWFIQGPGGAQSHGVEAQTAAQFEAAVRGTSLLGSQGRSQFIGVAEQGDYAHFIRLEKGNISEEISTRFGLFVRDTTLARSSYEWNFPAELRTLLNAPEYADLTVLLAVGSEARLENMGSIYGAYYEWFRSMQSFVVLLVVGGAALLVLLGTFIRFRTLSMANHGVARFFGRFWLEIKLVITAVALYLGANWLVGAIWWDVSSIVLFLPCFWWCWCMLLDVCINKKAFFTHNCITSGVRFYRALESKYPFLERMKKRAGLLLAAETVLIIMVALLAMFAQPTVISQLPVFLAVALVLVGFALLFWYIRAYNRDMDDFGLIVDYAHKIRSGTAQEPLSVKPESAFAPLADDLSEIHSGISSAVEERVRSEKMKAELVTNVSHDLKTPLTSIINYIGLLDKEMLSPEHANDYVDILGQKTQRLKNLVQDLFEVSRANSGAVEMRPEALDVVSLVEQTVAELDERTRHAGVEIKTQFSAPRIDAVADGRQLHRVFENLLGNALKYSLAGTRVYIEARETKSGAEITFKNVAGYEMDFTAEDIVERFQRGDSSRTTEGSGLGLAIAKSFVELNGGTLKIELDGDLFKASVWLPAQLPEKGTPAHPKAPAEPAVEATPTMEEPNTPESALYTAVEQELQEVHGMEQALNEGLTQAFSLHTPLEAETPAAPAEESPTEEIPMEEIPAEKASVEDSPAEETTAAANEAERETTLK